MSAPTTCPSGPTHSLSSRSQPSAPQGSTPRLTSGNAGRFRVWGPVERPATPSRSCASCAASCSAASTYRCVHAARIRSRPPPPASPPHTPTRPPAAEGYRSSALATHRLTDSTSSETRHRTTVQAQDHGRVASRVGRLGGAWLVEMPSFPGRRSDRTARSAVSAGSVGAVHRPVVAVDELACVGAPRALLPPSADRSGAGMVAHLGPGRRRARWPRSVHPAGGESGGRSGGSPPVVRLGQRRGRGPGGRCG